MRKEFVTMSLTASLWHLSTSDQTGNTKKSLCNDYPPENVGQNRMRKIRSQYVTDVNFLTTKYAAPPDNINHKRLKRSGK